MSCSLLCRSAFLCAFALSEGVFAQDPAALPIRAALEQTQVNGLHKFYRVDEHIYRSAQPSREGLQGLPKLGIKTVIDLRGASERASESELLGSMGIKYVNIPMPSLGAPSIESVKQALALLVDQNAWPILIHCERGADRTGTVIACLRMSQDGWSNQKALDEAKRLGLASIQTAKKHFILNWPASATASSVQARAAQAN
jgi:tyrosine-protein phosphatase SIW14